ncbi:hypothetical protein H6P81_012215 [Aristolochia fimbriata]|uniref:Uncharacterized protein n=1 Tax=Aristolochia fimbriata TaxID=158543 RepID=A0AAV7EEF0_ARIFI|nr:hypothetical protein H6P81_012215 [Aristolochia fimbriata]
MRGGGRGRGRGRAEPVRESALTRLVNAVFGFVRLAEFEILFGLFLLVAFLIFKDLTSRPEYNQILVKKPRDVAALKDLLPVPKSTTMSFYDHSKDSWFKDRFTTYEPTESASIQRKIVPPYGKRAGFVPRKPEDFGDGGAFPEIHVAQYPLGMGRKSEKPRSKILPLTVDAQGNVALDAIVKQDENASKIVYTQYRDLIPKILRGDEEQAEEFGKEVEETTQSTKAALEKIINTRLSAAQPKNVPQPSTESKFIKYKPSQQSAAFNSGLVRGLYS